MSKGKDCRKGGGGVVAGVGWGLYIFLLLEVKVSLDFLHFPHDLFAPAVHGLLLLLGLLLGGQLGGELPFMEKIDESRCKGWKARWHKPGISWWLTGRSPQRT